MRVFDELFGPGHVYCPAVAGAARRWLPLNPESLSGGQLPFFRETPYFCHAGVASRKGLDHLAESGHALPSLCYSYRDDVELVAGLEAYARDGWKIVANHFPFPDSLPHEVFWTSPELVSRINHKGLLAEWVSDEHLPQREVISVDSLVGYKGPFPVVLKVATWQSSGGGAYVIQCRSQYDLKKAVACLGDAEQVVLEQWIDFTELWCLNFVITKDGALSYLGGAQQMIADDLIFIGNRFYSHQPCSTEMQRVGQKVAERICKAGYYGVVGMDIGIALSGEFFVFDINGRMNASTAPLLALSHFPWLGEYPVQQTVRLHHMNDLADLIRLSSLAVHEKRFLPLSTFDPSVAGLEGMPFIAGLINGDNTQDINDYLTEKLGQSPSTRPMHGCPNRH